MRFKFSIPLIRFSVDLQVSIRVLGILAKFSDQCPNFSKVVPKIVVWKNVIFLEFALKLRSRQAAQVSLNFFLARFGPNGVSRAESPFD